MKKQLLPLVGVLVLLLAAGSAFAQVRTLRADIPFEFQVNGKMLPAGNYIISRVNETSSALVIQNHETRQAQMMVPHSVESKPSPTTKLVFRVYGDRYFLYRIWVEGEGIGKELSKSPAETRVAKEMQKSQDVYVAAALR